MESYAETAPDTPERTRPRRGRERASRGRSYRARRAERARTAAARPPKKLTGPGFYVLLAFLIFKDLSDIAVNIISAIALVIPPVSALMLFLLAVLSFIAMFATGLYLYLSGVKPTTRKIVTWGISFIMESVEALSALPTSALFLVLMRYMENSAIGRTAARIQSAKGK